MASSRWLGPLLLGALSVLACFAGVVALLNAVGCCAIDCETFPEQCEENRRRQETAAVAMLAAFTVSAASLGGAVVLARRRG